MPTFASTDGPKSAIPIKNKRYQIPRYPFDGPMPLDAEPVAGTGMLVPWTRTSTILDTHKDKEGIFKWTKRLVVKGIGDRDDLYALAAATRLSDKFQLSDIADQAFDYAKGQAASNLGSALHGFLERHLEGDKTLVIPERYRADVAVVMAAFQEAGIRLRPEFQEVVVVRPDRKDGDAGGMAGRLDLLVEMFNPITGQWELVVADYKTGSDPLEYGSWEIQQQGGFYGSGWAIWDGEFWRPMPAGIRRDIVLMIHVLPGQASVQIHELQVDLDDLEEDLDAAYRTRRRRKEAKKAHRPLVTVEDGSVLVDPASVPEGHPVREVLDSPLSQDTVSRPARPSRSQMVPSSDPWTTKTPDQLEQERKRNERLAKLSEITKPNDGDLPEDNLIRQAEPGEPKTMTITDADGRGPVAKGGDGKALQPLAGPGERGCSVCGRKGHRKGGAACLGDADPSKAVPYVERDPVMSDAVQAQREMAARDHPGGHSWTRDPVEGTWSCSVGGEAAAPEMDVHLTMEQKRSDGPIVTDFPGQVTAAELDANRPATLAAKVDQEMSDGDHDSRASALRAVASREAEVDADGDPFQEDKESPEDWAKAIAGCESKADIRAVRAEATKSGAWTDELLQLALKQLKTFPAS